VERRTSGIVIEKRTTGRQDIPRVIKVEIVHSQAKREMYARYFVATNVQGHELALRKHLPVIVELLGGVRRLRRIDEPANRDDGVVVCRLDAADLVIGGQHEANSDRSQRPNQAICGLTGSGR